VAKNIEVMAEALLACAGHFDDPEWARLALEVGLVTDRSNTAYGDSTTKAGQLMAILWPNGVPPSRMHEAFIMVRILDKLSRVVTDKDAFGESPWRDVAGYALLALRHDLQHNPERER